MRLECIEHGLAGASECKGCEKVEFYYDTINAINENMKLDDTVEFRDAPATGRDNSPQVEFIAPILENIEGTTGVGSVALKGRWFRLRINIAYLEQAVQALKVTQYYSQKPDKIDLIVSEDKPLIIGKIDTTKGIATGFLIAPVEVTQ